MLINKDDWLDLKLRLWSNSLGQSWKERSLGSLSQSSLLAFKMI